MVLNSSSEIESCRHVLRAAFHCSRRCATDEIILRARRNGGDRLSVDSHSMEATPFIEQQRQRLTELRQTLLDAARNAADEGTDVNAASAGGAREYEEDAQNLTLLQSGEELAARTVERLTRVERALAKIAEGTYGFSDLSAEPIPRERLVTVPEAVCTFEEQQAFESSAVGSLNHI